MTELPPPRWLKGHFPTRFRQPTSWIGTRSVTTLATLGFTLIYMLITIGDLPSVQPVSHRSIILSP